MTAPFDPGALEAGYAFLDGVPAGLLDAVVTSRVGDLRERALGVTAWREALLAGTMPPPSAWPPPAVAASVRQALVELGLPRFCRDQPELVDRVLTDVLSGFERGQAALDAEVDRQLRELERQRAAEQAQQGAKGARRPPLAPFDRAKTRAELVQKLADRAVSADATVLAEWSERARAWASIADIFGDLGSMMGRGWDLAAGVLKHVGWHDLVRLRALIAKLPQIQDVARSLGRLQVSDVEPSVAEQILEPVRRLEQELREVLTPIVPVEIRGLERSGELARMLPVEAVQLGHPKLKMLWHARRAERALLTYRAEGVEVERVEVEREGMVERPGIRPRPERGPIIAVIDTSGSMNGVPEQVAKALVLELARVAHAERRRCYLYAYSGPGQVLEHELDVGPRGIGRLLEFLQASFGGGTDIGALTAVLRRLEQETWRRADVVVATDGEWRAPGTLVDAVVKARAAGTRFHGVQIGAVGRSGLHDLCDPVHVFRDWASVGGRA